ncbi:MAG TPA: maleylpyruvate isomerase N-terminal domain-containing protein [Nocardioidaceae bacterium]|nr:maleylpyruvate isomerase N-terminal domain-containing protein [Nocardioidaceae bacterium]
MTGVPEFDAFEAAATALAGLTEQIGDDDWAGPGLGEWDLRSLVGHTTRAVSTVTSYVDQPADREDASTPAEYFTTVARLSRSTQSTVVAEAVTQRGRDAGVALGERPAEAVAELVQKALDRLRDQDDVLLSTPVGGMLLSSYLPTRTFELAVHSLDIAAAIGIDLQLDSVVLADSIALAAEAAARSGQGVPVLLALTGRAPLPDGFSVV